MIDGFSIIQVSKTSHFPLYFCFFDRKAGGRFIDLGTVSPKRPIPNNFLQASDPHLTSDIT